MNPKPTERETLVEGWREGATWGGWKDRMRNELMSTGRAVSGAPFPQRLHVRPSDPARSLLAHLQGGHSDHSLSWEARVCVFSRVRLLATLWTAARQAPLSLGFSRQECWSGSPCPPPGDLPDPGIEPASPALQADSLLSEPSRKLDGDSGDIMCFVF